MTNSHGDLLGPHVQRYLAMLNEEEAAHISKHPNVQYVSLSETSKLLTTHSWVFLRLAIENGNFPNASIWKKSLGEDIIIGNIDTGVWPESESFNDEGMGPIPAKWRGICQTNRDNWDNFHCNKKLIGARYFYHNFCQSDGGGHSLLFSPRDYDGHGTHTLATAGGNFVPRASSCGLGHGTASGGAPRARVACYKVFWPNDKEEQQCNDLDVVDAYDAAIHDGVDVISVSMGYDKDRKFTYGGTYRSSFKAVANGKIVVKAAGNKGPKPKTIVNCEPWAITVAATTTDRDFFCDVTLGDNRVFKAKAFNKFKLRHGKFYPLASGADVKYHYASDTDAMFCKTGALDPNKVKGKIIFCYLGGGSDENTKAKEAYSLGAIGLILGRDRNREVQVVDDQDPLPTAHVDYKDAVRILKYINYNRYPVAHISKVRTEYDVKPAPYVASFSSRGPNPIDEAILKPDITAPGVGIVAVYGGSECGPFIKMTGTSMACPHVAGVAAVLKSIYPNWSPAKIKSAIMTTASVYDTFGRPMKEHDEIRLKTATPFAYGAGELQPNRVANPGLVYDITTEEYLNYLWFRGACAGKLDEFYKPDDGPYEPPRTKKEFNILNLNYPTITVPYIQIGHPVVLIRTVENVGCPGKYRVKVTAPSELKVDVEPQILAFKFVGEKKQFRVTLTLRDTPETDGYVFGMLVWMDGSRHKVNTPIIVRYS
ncbi:unnamed protein product [Trifolium pratense]|uniref:Uncharacterized protein n=1 Tax=Trifolium pratense TaxID=57577 RepID=A0ACB0J3U2_TRIPR|nr:unnamed protein product [Trifolium pratense]